jgi:hypothetical protein
VNRGRDKSCPRIDYRHTAMHISGEYALVLVKGSTVSITHSQNRMRQGLYTADLGLRRRSEQPIRGSRHALRRVDAETCLVRNR